MPDDEITPKEEQAAARRRASAARIGSNASWARTWDRPARTAAARSAFMDRFEDQVDPNRELDPQVRAAMADSAMRAYMGSLAKRRQKNKAKQNTTSSRRAKAS